MISFCKVSRCALLGGFISGMFLVGCKTPAEPNATATAATPQVETEVAAIVAPVSACCEAVAPAPGERDIHLGSYKLSWIVFQVPPESMKVLGDKPDQYEVLLQMTKDGKADMTIAMLPILDSKTATLTASSKLIYPETYSEPFQLRAMEEKVEPATDSKGGEPVVPTAKVTRPITPMQLPEGSPTMAPLDFVTQEIGSKIEVTLSEFSHKEINLAIRPQNIVCGAYPGEGKDAVGYPSRPEFQNFEITTEIFVKLDEPTLLACFPPVQGDKKRIARLYYVRVGL